MYRLQYVRKKVLSTVPYGVFERATVPALQGKFEPLCSIYGHEALNETKNFLYDRFLIYLNKGAYVNRQNVSVPSSLSLSL